MLLFSSASADSEIIRCNKPCYTNRLNFILTFFGVWKRKTRLADIEQNPIQQQQQQQRRTEILPIAGQPNTFTARGTPALNHSLIILTRIVTMFIFYLNSYGTSNRGCCPSGVMECEEKHFLDLNI